MFPWLQTAKLDQAGDGTAGGAAGVMTVDPGAPVEIGGDPAPAPVEKKADPNEARFKALETQITDLRKQNTELSASERYWADRASKVLTPAEPEERTTPAEVEVKTTPEQDLDEIAKIGLAEVMRKRGFVSKSELNAAVAETESRANQNLQAARTDATFDAQISTEFPEIKADHDRIAAGKKPESPLFVRAAEIYRSAVAADPSLGTSKSALLIAARQAKAELAAEAATKPGEKTVTPIDDNRQQRRRDRIDSQRSERTAAGGEEGDETPSLTPQQLEVIKRTGISQADFIKNSGVTRSGR